LPASLFGSKLLSCGQHSVVRTQTLGTVQYMPPELLSMGRMSRATDTYSLAMIGELVAYLAADVVK